MARMVPSPAERDELLRGFARALFKNDMDALYRVVAPDFLWSFHDGLATTKALAGPAAIREHLAGQKAQFSEQRFHEVAYHHSEDATFMTFRVSETVRDNGEQREQRGIECYTFRDGKLAPRTFIASQSNSENLSCVVRDIAVQCAIAAFEAGISGSPQA